MPERIKTKFDDSGQPMRRSHSDGKTTSSSADDKTHSSQKSVDSQNLGRGTKAQQAVPSTKESHADHAPRPGFIQTGVLGRSVKAKAEIKTQHGPTASKLKDRALFLLKSRQKLPIWAQRQTIKESLANDKDLLLLVGETGSGKSTQVPQFIVDEPWAKRQKVQLPSGNDTVNVGGCIAITEPRKVAAVSLARRVAEEVGTPLGSSSPASTVGYHVRFDHSASSNTKIKFLTEGMLLQEMIRDPWLRQYSAVVVDEVHERNVNVDLILGFLRNMLVGKKDGRGGIPLKLVVMSATADLDTLQTFFSEIVHPNSSFPHEAAIPTSVCRIMGRQFPVRVLYSPNPNNDIIDAALRLVFQINFKEPLPGDILIFLTGQETVESLEKLLNDYAPGLKKDVPKLLPLPLFAALPQTSQQRVFQAAPHRTRKVIIATNIAETSVTVPGVRHVIDCGMSKIKQYRAQLGLESLLCKAISQSAATQRTGRAGREAPGTCYRLYTEKSYREFDKDATPEILRCDIAQAILTMKARGIDSPWAFPLLNPPPLKSIKKGLEKLIQLDALVDGGEITESGSMLAHLPLSAALGKVLLTAAEPELCCVAEIIDIISCLSVEAIFIQPSDDEDRERAYRSRSELIRREGDHLTLLNTMQAYTVENSDRRSWCENRLVSHRAMRGAWDVRKQLRTQAATMQLNINFDPKLSDTPSPAVSSEDRVSAILQCLLKGFVSNTAVLCRDGAYRTCDGRHEIAIHPASTLFGKKVEAIVYNEFVYTNRGYARNVSAVQAQWIMELVQ